MTESEFTIGQCVVDREVLTIVVLFIAENPCFMRAQCGLENAGRKERDLESTKEMATVSLHSWTRRARGKVNPYDCVPNSPRCRWLSTVGALSWAL